MKNKFQKIKNNPDLLVTINNDMLKHGGKFIPSSHWLSVNKKYQKIDQKKDLTNMLDDLVGYMGCRKITREYKAIYNKLFKAIDGLKLADLLDKNSLLTDYGSVMDVNLIRIFARIDRKKVTKIVEIGGGYGRLAEVFNKVYGSQVKHVLVDAVPVSIMYSYLYLKAILPNSRIGFFYNNDPYDLEKYDIYIMPSWQFEKLNSQEFDIGINVESFQEMNQEEVDRYLSMFDKIIASNGHIYLSNAHDYVFKGEWKYPANWRCLFKYNTPRSWTLNHPTEIYQKNNFNNKDINVAFEYFSLIDAKTKVNVQGISGHIESKVDLTAEIKKLYSLVTEKDKQISELNLKLKE